MERKYKRTLYASYIGYITQAIINNLAPLLFVIFQNEYHISVTQIGFLVSFNFGVQILVDFLAVRYVDKIGHKNCIVAAHVLCGAGLVCMSLLPDLLPSPYMGLLCSIAIYAIGGGLIEVLVSPLVEALPTDEKSAAMSLLHSFYCWGHALVVILTTVFFRLAGTQNWKIVTWLWSIVPFFNVFLFAASPILVLTEDGEAMPVKKLLKMKLFWLFALLMVCSGASELAMSQWASFFAERGLQVSKTLGDLLGPCMFAILMGISRWFYGVKGDRIPLKKYIVFSSILCVISYLVAVFAPHPVISLIGCGICGLSVGIMWPGVYSLAAEHCIQGGTAMFALLALAGDLGCASGPAIVGSVSELFNGEMKAGLLAATIFPLVLLIGIKLMNRKKA